MEIKYSDLKSSSKLRKRYVDVGLQNTAGFSLSAGYNAYVVIPFRCHIDKIFFANDVDITASNGIHISVCNATTDVVNLAAAGAGHIWSACSVTGPSHVSGSLDWTANIFHQFDASTTLVPEYSLLHIAVSATNNTCPIAMTLVLDPDVGE